MDAMPSDRIEMPSGKGSGDENFPVGSFLISRRLRPHVTVYYAFARAIDDIADRREALALRLEAVEARLLRQFNALDGLLAQLQGTSDFLTQQLASLPGVVLFDRER